jgi:hypothetical protein
MNLKLSLVGLVKISSMGYCTAMVELNAGQDKQYLICVHMKTLTQLIQKLK